MAKQLLFASSDGQIKNYSFSVVLNTKQQSSTVLVFGFALHGD